MAPETAQEPQTGQTGPKLSTARRLLLNGLAEGKSVAEAAKDARMLRTSAYRAIDDMREQLPSIMDDCGLDVRSILTRLREKWDARETKFFSKDGQVTQTVDVECHTIQLDAIKTSAMLRPELAQKGSVNVGTVNILWTGNAPQWAHPDATPDSQPTLPNDNANATVQSDINTVQLDNSNTPTRSAVEGTEVAGGPSPRTHCPHCGGSSVGTLAQRTHVVKKRKPRLPVYQGEK